MWLSKGFDLVIFDCDGVVVDSKIPAMRAYQGLFAELGATARRPSLRKPSA